MDRGCSGLCWSPPLSRLGGAGWEVLRPSPEPAIALPSSTSCWGQEPPPDGWNAASRDWNGHLPSLCSPVSPPGDDTWAPWGVEGPLPPVCPGTPMLCQERHPPLPPGACSSVMRMGLVLSPMCLVLLSCPLTHPLPLSRHRNEDRRAGTGSARAAAACGDPAFRPCGLQSQAGCRGAALAFKWLPPCLQGGVNSSCSPPPHSLQGL